jgi:hypothetical protein
MVLVTGIHWALLAFRIPLLDSLPYWKYKLHPIPLVGFWLAAAFFAFGLALIVTTARMKPAIKITLLILLGTAIQYSFAFSKGQGLDAIRDRIVSSGHAEFAKAAVEQPGDMLWVAQHYEEVAAKKKYGYIGSKPPGTFLFYMAFERLSYLLYPAEDHVKRLENLRNVASLAWPLLSYLVMIPLYFLTLEISGDRTTALLGNLFYVSVPSVSLITLHVDQVLYPFLAVLPVLTGLIAFRRDAIGLAALCGAALYVSVYFSFSLAAVAIFLPLPALTSISADKNAAIGRIIKYGAGIITGGALVHSLAVVLLKYDIAARYSNAWANHLAWKGWDNNIETLLRAGFTNLVEFSVWVGLPLMILFLKSFSVSVRGIQTRKADPAAYLNILLGCIFAFLLVFGKTKAEVARLWLFLLPFLCAAVSVFIRRQKFTDPGRHLLLTLILFLQMGTTYFTLAYQDFS